MRLNDRLGRTHSENCLKSVFEDFNLNKDSLIDQTQFSKIFQSQL